MWAEFADVQGLTTGAQVRVAGVKAGAVREIRLEPDRVRVALELKKGIELHEDAVARLDFQALSGARFLTIDRGSPDRKLLPPDATIRSESAAGISQMVDELDKVGGSLRTLADSLNENQDRLLKTVSEMLDENRQGLAQTVKNLGRDHRQAEQRPGHARRSCSPIRLSTTRRRRRSPRSAIRSATSAR